MARRNQEYQEERSRGGCGGCLLAMLIAFLAVAIAGFIGYKIIGGEISGSARSKGDTETPIVLTVEEGSSTIGIAQMLADNGVIKNKTIFRLYSQITDASSSFMYGEHTFYRGMSYDDIILELQDLLIEKAPSNTITFPEGKTSLSMAQTLENYGYGTVEEFLDICNNQTFNVSFYNYITDNPLKFNKLEGYLFPDTYEFPLDATMYDCIEMMLKNWEKNVWTEEFRSDLAASGYSLDEIITLSSIVEKEAFDGTEGMVASVFWNRLLRPIADLGSVPMLQSDTTDTWIQYVLEYYYEGSAPQDMVNAYNSDFVEGIIVGAICNPGINCIKATLHPEVSNYYFFVTDDAKNYYWAETYYEHVNNCAIADSVNAQIAAGTYEG